MRIDPVEFQSSLQTGQSEPRFVISIQYSTSSPYFTSRTGISNVPGVPVQGVLEDISVVSQELNAEEGRSTIGALSFRVVDVSSAVTDELRTQLDTNDEGPRRKEVRLYIGYTDDFNDYVRIATQQVASVTLEGGSYRISCNDIQRSMRNRIFEQKKTRLTQSITDSATTFNVQDTSDFSIVAHTAAFTQDPSTTVGYAQVKKTKEIFSYTGKTSTTFTGITRGLFGTVAQKVDIDAGTASDKLPEIIEFIYLEMPMAEMAYALLTGVIKSSTASPQNTLPSHWHLGIDESLVDSTSFDNIGLDLFDATDATAGLVGRFTHLKGVDGKRFIEQELMIPMGTYLFVDALGALNLRRTARMLTNASFVTQLNETNIVSASVLEHDQNSVINQILIRWNYDGNEGDFTRDTFLTDANSITRNGESTIKRLEFRGLVGSRHTDATINRIFLLYADRYGEPPERMTVRVLPSMSNLEVGDVVSVQLAHLRDYQGATTVNRSFEITRTSVNPRTGETELQLFGTSRETPAEVPAGTTNAVPDAFYTSEGTNLTSVLTISSGQVTANGTVTGTSDLTATGSIFYYDGDLQINSGITVTIENNVQLRIKGTLTVNGDVDGVGNGIAGKSDPDTVGTTHDTHEHYLTQGVSTRGYAGVTRGSDGIIYFNANSTWGNHNAPIWKGVHDVAPILDLNVTGTLVSPVATAISGFPIDLRGTPGMHGGRALDTPTDTFTRALGGDGGASGAGLLILCRGIAFGVSGAIDISGGNGSAGNSATVGGKTVWAGGGGGGGPGTLYVILDGQGISYPDLDPVVASTGTVTQTGTPPQSPIGLLDSAATTGYWPGYSAVDMWGSVVRAQYLGVEQETGDSVDEAVPPPDNLAASAVIGGALITWDNAPNIDKVQLYESVDNNRSNATLLFEGVANAYYRASSTSVTRYWWVRSVDDARGFSAWEPVSSTAGVSTTFGGDPTDPSTFVYRQSAAPGSPVEGTLWIDTDDLRVYRYNGSTWDQIAADDALLLSSNAPSESGADVTSSNTAAAISGQGNLATQDASDLVYRQASAPSHQAGRIWYDTDDGRFYRSNGSTWQQIAADDPTLSSFNAAAESGADATANNASNIIYRQSTAPGSAQTGWVWQDTDDSRVYRYNGSTWDQIAADDALLIGSNAPAESGANVTETRLSANDLGDTSTFSSPSWGGFSTAPSGSIAYAVSEDGRFAELWFTADRFGTSGGGSPQTMSISNLPSAIRPAGSGSSFSLGLGIARDNSSTDSGVAARVWQASHGSAGTIEFGRLLSTGLYNFSGWTTSNQKGLTAGTRFRWPL